MSGKKAKQKRQAERALHDDAVHRMAMLLRKSMNTLRQEFARRVRFGRAKFPDLQVPVCETCAFRTNADFTDGEMGFLETTLGLITALDRGTTFYCHMPADDESRAKFGENKYQPKKDEFGYVPCAGWMYMHAKAPEPLNVREHLGDAMVDMAVEGNRLFNEAPTEGLSK